MISDSGSGIADRLQTHTGRLARILAGASVLVLLLLSACAPKEVRGEVMKEDWTEYECTAWTRITSGDVVGLRFKLSKGGSPGFDPLSLKDERLTGKKIRCELGAALAVQHCTVLDREGEHRIRRIDER